MDTNKERKLFLEWWNENCANRQIVDYGFEAIGQDVAYHAWQARAFLAQPPTDTITVQRSEWERITDALEEIALAGMSPPMGFTEDETKSFHARQAWRFIGIAARAITPSQSTKEDV